MCLDLDESIKRARRRCPIAARTTNLQSCLSRLYSVCESIDREMAGLIGVKVDVDVDVDVDPPQMQRWIGHERRGR